MLARTHRLSRMFVLDVFSVLLCGCYACFVWLLGGHLLAVVHVSMIFCVLKPGPSVNVHFGEFSPVSKVQAHLLRRNAIVVTSTSDARLSNTTNNTKPQDTRYRIDFLDRET